jgi:hypothetical protein
MHQRACSNEENQLLGIQIQALRRLCGQYKVAWDLPFRLRLEELDLPGHPTVVAAIGARERMVTGNLGLVRIVCSRIKKANTEDLFQEGVLALLKAIDHYEPQRGSFATYASPWIRGAVLDAAYDQVLLIREPRYRRSLGRGRWRPRWQVVPLPESTEGID